MPTTRTGRDAWKSSEDFLADYGDQQAEVDRLLSLDATRVDIGQGEVTWVVMADPDGHEFCVLTPR
ncbi:MAG TPA: VOC family protein [Pseudonocardiaceae bacterium]|nr:VOC family protein [Pseudonocardiaceae bacterium]